RHWQFFPDVKTNEALPQTDEVYAEDGALIAIANDKVDSDRACRDDALNIRARSSVGRKTRGRPESGMSVARSVADVLRDHVVLELEADRKSTRLNSSH